jgi:hypothetical protein
VYVPLLFFSRSENVAEMLAAFDLPLIMHDAFALPLEKLSANVTDCVFAHCNSKPGAFSIADALIVPHRPTAIAIARTMLKTRFLIVFHLPSRLYVRPAGARAGCPGFLLPPLMMTLYMYNVSAMAKPYSF